MKSAWHAIFRAEFRASLYFFLEILIPTSVAHTRLRVGLDFAFFLLVLRLRKPFTPASATVQISSSIIPRKTLNKLIPA